MAVARADTSPSPRTSGGSGQMVPNRRRRRSMRAEHRSRTWRGVSPSSRTHGAPARRAVDVGALPAVAGRIPSNPVEVLLGAGPVPGSELVHVDGCGAVTRSHRRRHPALHHVAVPAGWPVRDGTVARFSGGSAVDGPDVHRDACLRERRLLPCDFVGALVAVDAAGLVAGRAASMLACRARCRSVQ